jgi:drug/metabolite transporter (DMT)-like permease
MTVPPWKTWTALGLVYVVWGSTYLAIRYAVDGLPPLLTAAERFVVAAAMLVVWVLYRRGGAVFKAPGRQWAAAALVGLLLLLGGNGLVMVAEDQHLPSGLTALIVAAVPLFVVALRWLGRDQPAPRTLLGVAIGFCGLAVLLLPGARPSGVPVGAAALVVLGSALWSVGSFLAGRLVLPSDPLVATIGEMLGGAAGLGIAAALHGERPVLHGVPASAWWAFWYLVVFGAVVAFTAYSWLLANAPLSQAATYAYVNPVVAVLLGAVVAGERLSTTSVLGGLVTVVAVFVVVSEEGRARPAYGPTERQGRLRSSET